jgi:hypothetical protein
MFFRATFIAAAILAAATVFAGTGFAPLAKADDNDQAFIETLDKYGLQYGKPLKATLMAKTFVCGELDADPSATLDDVVSGVADNTNWSYADSAYFAGVAIAAYCPKYKYKVIQTPAT